jgi:hypothetical protein
MRKVFSQFVTALTLVAGVVLLASTMWAQDAGSKNQPQPGDQTQAQQAATKSFVGTIVKQGDQ